MSIHNLTKLQTLDVLMKAISDGVPITVNSVDPHLSFSGDVDALAEIHKRIEARQQINLPPPQEEDEHEFIARLVEKVKFKLIGTQLDGCPITIDSATSFRIDAEFDGKEWVGRWQQMDDEPDVAVIVDTLLAELFEFFRDNVEE